jgi:hypothetical protein
MQYIQSITLLAPKYRPSDRPVRRAVRGALPRLRTICPHPHGLDHRNTTRILPLLRAGAGLALIANNGVQLDLNGILGRVSAKALAPVVANRVGEDVAFAREACGGDGAADLGVALEAMLCVLVPEVEGAVGAGGAEGAVLRVEGDGVDGVDFGHVALGGVLLAVAFEGEVEAGGGGVSEGERGGCMGVLRTWCPCLRRTGSHSVPRCCRRRSPKHR